MAYLYRHIRLDKNEPFYIGICSQDDNYHRSKRITNRNKIWIDVFKKTPIRIEIVFDGISWEDACKKEREFIKLYGRIDNGTGTLSNLTDGGDGYLNPNKETRDKLSKAKLGSKNPMFGKEITNNHRTALKSSRIGRIPFPAKSLVNTSTGELFPNIYSAAKTIGISYKALYKRISRKSKSITLKFI